MPMHSAQSDAAMFMKSDEIRVFLRKQGKAEMERCVDELEKQNEKLKSEVERTKETRAAQELVHKYFVMKLWEKLPPRVKPRLRDFLMDMCKRQE